MSKSMPQGQRVPERYYFGRPPEVEKTDVDSPFRLFVVKCLRCGSSRLKAVGQFDEDSGETAVFLICPRCNIREQVPVK